MSNEGLEYAPSLRDNGVQGHERCICQGMWVDES